MYAQLVKEAFCKVNTNLGNISIFHNDNAVAGATFKVIKTEFVKKRVFKSLPELKLELADYIK